jgi:hypothetical protein
MRKADYALLARLLQTRYLHALELFSEYNDMETRKAGKERMHLVEGLANSFAANASVDRVQFLKACGIE